MQIRSFEDFSKAVGVSRLGARAIFGGRFLVMTLEELGEILHVQNAAMKRHGLNLQLGVFQQVCRVFHAAPMNVGGNGVTGLLFEPRGKIAEADALIACTRGGRKIGGEIGIDGQNDSLHDGGILLDGVLADGAAIGAKQVHHEGGAFRNGAQALDPACKLRGDLVQLKGMNPTLLCRLSQKCVHDDAVVFGVSKGIGVALFKKAYRKGGAEAALLVRMSERHGTDHLVFKGVATLQCLDVDQGVVARLEPLHRSAHGLVGAIGPIGDVERAERCTAPDALAQGMKHGQKWAILRENGKTGIVFEQISLLLRGDAALLANVE